MASKPIDQDHGRERAQRALKDAGYPDKVPKSGGRPVHFGPNAENASKLKDESPLVTPTKAVK